MGSLSFFVVSPDVGQSSLFLLENIIFVVLSVQSLGLIIVVVIELPCSYLRDELLDLVIQLFDRANVPFLSFTHVQELVLNQQYHIRIRGLHFVFLLLLTLSVYLPVEGAKLKQPFDLLVLVSVSVLQPFNELGSLPLILQFV